jgi:hypothetical protein
MPRRTVADGYAHDTSVPVDRSKAQIEKLLMQHGAQGFQTGWQGATTDARGTVTDPGWDVIGFKWKERWRILHLVIKAKLEAVQAGVSIFEEEFLAHIVTESQQTIGQILVPRIQAGGQILRRLEAPKPGPGGDVMTVEGEVV